MSKLNFGSVEAPVLFAAPPKGPVELAAFATADGKKLVSNADRTPYSPDDGAQMQILSSDRTVLSARQVASCVTIGKCPACQSRLVASASMADCIEVASEDIHCPICTAAVTPAIDLNVLTSALRDEFSEDDEGDDDAETADEDFGDDSDDDADEGDDADDSDEDFDDDDSDEDYDDDFSDDDSDEDFGDDSDDDFSDDDADDSDDDAGEDDVDDEIATAAAQLRRRIKKRRLAAKASDDSDADDSDADADDEVEAVEASMRKRMKKSKKRRATAAEDIDDGVVDDAGEPDGDGDEDDMESARVRRRVPGKFRRKKLVASDDVTDVDDVDADADDADGFSPEENEVIASLASVVRRTYAKHGLALGSTERTVAGRASRRSGKVDAVLASARERLRGREGVDGNRRLKSLVAQAGEIEEIEMNETPAADDKEGKVNEAVPVDANNPGSATASKVAKAADGDEDLDDTNTETVVDNTDGVDGVDDADEVVAGDSTVDWRRAKPELVASEASENVHVFVDGRPVGTLVKAKASAGVVAQWDKPALRVGFAQAAAEGLMPETAAEFGFVAHSFVVKGDEVFRQTMRRVADINTRNSQREVAAGQERYQQAVKTSFLAAIKGVYPDLKNPVRDSLVASLHKCGVVDARTVVDKAFASLGDALVAGIFDKAKDLAAKPDAARNEAAQFVAQAAYQSRDVDPAVDLASRLAEGNRAAIPAAPVKPQQEVAKAGTTTADRVRAALRSIGR